MSPQAYFSTTPKSRHLHLFEGQNIQQIRLFNFDCSVPSVNYNTSFPGGRATIEIKSKAVIGQAYIVSVKYETGTVVGQDMPEPLTVHYDFETVVEVVNGQVLTTTSWNKDGLDLRQK